MQGAILCRIDVDGDVADVFFSLFEGGDHFADSNLVRAEAAVLLQADTYRSDILVRNLVNYRRIWPGDR